MLVCGSKDLQAPSSSGLCGETHQVLLMYSRFMLLGGGTYVTSWGRDVLWLLGERTYCVCPEEATVFIFRVVMVHLETDSHTEGRVLGTALFFFLINSVAILTAIFLLPSVLADSAPRIKPHSRQIHSLLSVQRTQQRHASRYVTTFPPLLLWCWSPLLLIAWPSENSFKPLVLQKSGVNSFCSAGENLKLVPC